MNLFFCGGIAKSGTTLLQRILNLHNDISCEFEDDLNYLLQEFIKIHKRFNGGRPDLVFMAYDPKFKNTVANNVGGQFTDDYDKAKKSVKKAAGVE